MAQVMSHNACAMRETRLEFDKEQLLVLASDRRHSYQLYLWSFTHYYMLLRTPTGNKSCECDGADGQEWLQPRTTVLHIPASII